MIKRILKWGLAVFFLSGFLLFLYGVFIEPDRLVIRNIIVESEKWPADARPLRIAALSDIHTGSPFIDPDKLRLIVERTNAEQPDVVVLLGDYVIHGVLGGDFVAPERTAEILAGFDAPTFAVLGNHDWWFDGPRIRKAFEANGIVVLDNQVQTIVLQEQAIQVMGIADDMAANPDITLAESGLADAVPVIQIMHDPAVFAETTSRPALTLAGHSHGGQVYLPWLFPPVMPGRGPSRWAYGIIEEDGKTMVVTGGIGTSIFPIRINMPPEIMLVTLSGKL